MKCWEVYRSLNARLDGQLPAYVRETLQWHLG